MRCLFAWCAGPLILLAAGCSGQVTAERATLDFYTWAQRGQTLGEYARLYCTLAAERQRQVMRWGIESAAGGTKVVIYCPEKPLDTGQPLR